MHGGGSKVKEKLSKEQITTNERVPQIFRFAVELNTAAVTDFYCHVTALAARTPSIPHSLVTRNQAKAVGKQNADEPNADDETEPTAASPLTPLPPTPPPKARVLVDSDSDLDLPPAPRSTNTMVKNATVEAIAGKPPIFHEGKCTQAALRQFEVAFANYCTLKAVTEESDKMAVAVGCFRDHKITDWLEMEDERPRILKMTFKEFMTTLRKRVLPKNWERDTRLSMNQRRQAVDESFLDFQTAVRALNSHLTNTDSHLDDGRLHNLLETNMLVELQEDYAADAKAKDEEDFPILARRSRAIAEQRERERERERERKRNATNDGGNERPAKRNGNTNGSPSGGGSGGGSSTMQSNTGGGGGGKRCPKLTTAEAELLNAHHGCRKCRKPYVAHAYETVKTCDFPPATNYKPVTQATINAALAALTAEQRRQFDLPPAPQTKPPPAAAIMNRNVGFNTAAAVLGEIEDPNDSGTTDEGLSERVSPSHRSPHLFWDFRMEVLIHPDVVDRLDLRRFKLHKPEPLGVAIDDPDAEPITMTEYVKFKALSNDLSWESNTVRALIAPNLAVDVILGLPWLERNHIHLPPPPKTPPMKLREKLRKTKADLKLLVTELKAVCAARLERMTASNLFEKVRDVDVVAAVRERIDTLAALAHYQKLGDDLKRRYKPIFEPIPHIDNLPDDVVCEIKMKDAHKTLSKRTYQSPRKYKEAWQTLIQRHLDAGRIRPSSSPHASPAFLIPKADKTALPRWVNDFRELNANTIHDVYPLPRVDDILADCAKGKIWSTIDFMDSFFQTRLHPNSIPYTAVSTPLGLYEWLVMPQGLRNAPSVQQRRHCCTSGTYWENLPRLP
ncbi:Reverse transcriptase-RNase H-integrase [Mycena sanguinolenta]|uniref:Reverse transcriptase-RNase H-integrase n=1 Tax=Mycena sanguinolenta TaxID=230812 RepID=A0A8H6WY43_9AGAR|nr:Reverse transcriptase-RNase H-integrase [Mycena sanguinolenta]